MSGMPAEGSMEANLSQGKYAKEGDGFRQVGVNPDDLASSGEGAEVPRGPGRPFKPDDTWRQVGRTADQEGTPKV